MKVAIRSLEAQLHSAQTATAIVSTQLPSEWFSKPASSARANKRPSRQMTWDNLKSQISIPRMATIGFKEWQVVCEALANGRQSIILRKGGIHEGRQGFSFAHESFFLFPTRFHAQADQVREGQVKVMPEWQPGELIQITHYAKALWAITVTEWEKVEALAPYHIYSEQTVRDRFDWEGKGIASSSIHVALVQVKELAEPWEFPYQKSYGGCRSWVDLPESPLDFAEFAKPVLPAHTLATISKKLKS